MNCLEAETLCQFADELVEHDCTKCTLHDLVRTTIVIYRGNDQAKVMIVGQNPGSEEDKEGLPFVGRSGKLLDRMFDAIHINTDAHCYLTNACLCWTPGNENPADYPGVLEACRPYLDKQINLLKPRIIIAVGKPAFESVTRRKCGSWLGHTVGNLSKNWGPVIDGNIIPIYPIMHPAYLLRNESAKPAAWEHMKLLSKIIQDMNIIPDYIGV